MIYNEVLQLKNMQSHLPRRYFYFIFLILIIPSIIVGFAYMFLPSMLEELKTPQFDFNNPENFLKTLFTLVLLGSPIVPIYYIFLPANPLLDKYFEKNGFVETTLEYNYLKKILYISLPFTFFIIGLVFSL